jgi:tetratricopeptide (TPR) repeat protein
MKFPPWTLLFFVPIVYFTLFDQPGYIPSIKPFSLWLAVLIFAPWLALKVVRRVPLPRTPLDALLPFFLAGQLLSALLSPAFRLTYAALWLLLLSILTFYLMLDLLHPGQREEGGGIPPNPPRLTPPASQEDALWRAVFLVAAIVLQLALLEFFTWYLGLSWLPGFEVSWPEVGGWTLPPNPRRIGLALLTVPLSPPFSAYVALFIPLAAGFGLSTRRLMLRLAAGGFILVSLVVLGLTFSRTGQVSLAVAGATFALLAWWRAGLRSVEAWLPGTWRTTFPIVAFLLLLLLFFVYYALSDPGRVGSTEHRFSLLRAAWRMWQDYPVLGIGPGLFPAFYRDYTPRQSFYPISIAAHSVYFQMLAEGGLVSLGFIGTVAAVAGRQIYRRLPDLKTGRQTWRLIGIIAVLAGFFAVMALEQLWWPAFIIPVSLAAACLFHPTPAHPGFRRWLPALYLLLLLLFAGVLLYVNQTAARFLQIVEQTGPGQELVAAEQIALLRAADPGLPIYILGQAYYQGKYLLKQLKIAPCTLPPEPIPPVEQRLLQESIALYEEGLTPIKGHSIYWANLAVLYWANGQPQQALSALVQAEQLSSTTSDFEVNIYLLNEGCYAELAGDSTRAVAAYGTFLYRNRQLVASEFWTSSEFRAGQYAEILERATIFSPEPRLIAAIEQELIRNNTAEAERLRAELLAAFPDAPATVPWRVERLLEQRAHERAEELAGQSDLLLGQVALARGDLAAARLRFRRILFDAPNDPDALYQLARVALVEGRREEAIGYLKRITLPFTPPDAAEAKFLYGYPTPFALYPSLLVMSRPPVAGRPFHLLAQLYREDGEEALAVTVEQSLSTYKYNYSTLSQTKWSHYCALSFLPCDVDSQK